MNEGQSELPPIPNTLPQVSKDNADAVKKLILKFGGEVPKPNSVPPTPTEK